MSLDEEEFKKYVMETSEQQLRDARRSKLGQNLAAKAWYDALDKLKRNEGEPSTLKMTRVSTKQRDAIKLTTYIVEYVVPLKDVWPFRIEFFETANYVRVLMTRQPVGVADLLLNLDGTFRRFNGVTTYSELLAEVFAKYCIDSGKVEELTEDATWQV